MGTMTHLRIEYQIINIKDKNKNNGVIKIDNSVISKT